MARNLCQCTSWNTFIKLITFVLRPKSTKCKKNLRRRVYFNAFVYLVEARRKSASVRAEAPRTCYGKDEETYVEDTFWGSERQTDFEDAPRLPAPMHTCSTFSSS